MKLRIIVFAKAPVPGSVKTRLVPALGQEGASRLAERMLGATLDMAVSAGVGAVELRMEPGPDDPAWQAISLPSGIVPAPQGQGDLGERLARAARKSLERGEAIIIIGTDCADLSVGLLRQAARGLASVDAVIYPAADGGYVLLGLTRFAPELFSDIPWSTEDVAAETIRRCESLGWTLHVGPTCHDIDVPGDLAYAPAAWLTESAS